ncbi:hypothetical protein A9Q96_03145 [Rhodobacterales bacterium 52_120_T64]|nr:hypothetical protein A9Q96_03145 [Rhodobacterales bacterium 52_120_T64]
MANVLITGMAVVDFVFLVDEMPTLPEKYRANDAAIVGGGCAANASVAIARLGGHAALATRLGSDQLGDLIVADLINENVDLQFVQRIEGGRSAFSSIYIDKSGERQIMNFRGTGFGDDAEWLQCAPKSDAYLTDSRWVSGAIETMKLAQLHNVPGIVDAEHPVDPELLKIASHVAFSLQGLIGLTGEGDVAKALHKVNDEFPCWVCVTDGANGVYSINAGQLEHFPAYTVTIKDTLAAGDIWHGAFALSLAEGKSEGDAIKFASAAAALKCTVHGGREGCPDRSTTEQFLKENM